MKSCPLQGFHVPEFVIRGIKYSDYETVQSNISIVDGDLGQRRVWIKLKSQPGYAIKVLFEFCGEKTALKKSS